MVPARAWGSPPTRARYLSSRPTTSKPLLAGPLAALATYFLAMLKESLAMDAGAPSFSSTTRVAALPSSRVSVVTAPFLDCCSELVA